eukprot:2718516-Lingulodinium_polyedra.AAC.1
MDASLPFSETGRGNAGVTGLTMENTVQRLGPKRASCTELWPGHSLNKQTSWCCLELAEPLGNLN